MYIRHHRDLLNIRGAPEMLNRVRHVSMKRGSQPTPKRSHRRITHRRPLAPGPARTTALALAFWQSPSPPLTVNAIHRAGACSSHRRRSSHPAQRYGPVDDRNQALAKPHLQTNRSRCQQRWNPRARGSAPAVLDSRTVVSSVALGGDPTDCRFLLHRGIPRSPRPRTPFLYLDDVFVSQSSLFARTRAGLQAHECACGFN